MSSSTPLSVLAAGGFSGVTVDLVLFPLDTIKTRLQARRLPGHAIPKSGSFYKGEGRPCVVARLMATRGSPPAPPPAPALSVAASGRPPPSCTLTCVLSPNGCAWAGLLSAMTASFPCAATFWFVYEATKGALAAQVRCLQSSAGVLGCGPPHSSCCMLIPLRGVWGEGWGGRLHGLAAWLRAAWQRPSPGPQAQPCLVNTRRLRTHPRRGVRTPPR
jgi:hypothetical protein